jgi:dTMP kinase
VVVCDRFYDSTLAYQGYGHGLDLTALRAITDFATGGLRPDLTFLIDLSAEDGLRRRRRGGQWNRLDAYDLGFHQRVRQGYFDLAAAEPGRWVTVDATRPVETVQSEIRRVVEERLERG